MSIKIIYGDISNYTMKEAVVIPANPNPIIGNGVDKLVYNLAGKNTILEERKKIGNLEFGKAVATSAGKLDSKIIIHAVSPVWDGGSSGEEELLRDCCINALQCAADNNCRSVVFPLLSTGVMKFPKELAKSIAISAIDLFLMTQDMDVTLVLYNKKKISPDLLEKIEKYIIECNYSNLDIEEYWQRERDWSDLPEDREERTALDLMRKQYARKQLCEERYNEFLKKQENWNGTTSAPFSDFIPGRYSYTTPIKNVEDYIRMTPERPSFTDVYNRF